MDQAKIRQLIGRHCQAPGIVQTALKGVQLFSVTRAMPCIPAVYEPSIVAILSGVKEAVLDGNRRLYDSSQYLLCPMTLPVEAGTPQASPETPLMGALISLDTRVMRDLTIELETVSGPTRTDSDGLQPGLALAHWDDGFSDALMRLLLLLDSPADIPPLGEGRLRELYYAVLKGEAGDAARHAFGVGNEIARTIQYLSSNLSQPGTIQEMAERAGMSRAAFHRRFKDATSMSPLQFVKAMRLNNAAMQIVSGRSIYEAARTVGYESASQFSREFKRLYGQSPRQWGQTEQARSPLA